MEFLYFFTPETFGHVSAPIGNFLGATVVRALTTVIHELGLWFDLSVSRRASPSFFEKRVLASHTPHLIVCGSFGKKDRRQHHRSTHVVASEAST